MGYGLRRIQNLFCPLSPRRCFSIIMDGSSMDITQAADLDRHGQLT